MLHNISLKKKLSGLVIVPVLLFLAVCIYLIQKNNDDLKHMRMIMYDITEQSTSLILNADRDMYQALIAYQSLGDARITDEDKKKQTQDLNENIVQVSDRVNKAGVILSDNQLLGLTYAQSERTVKQNLDRFEQNFSAWSGNAAAHASQIANFDAARESLNELGEFLDAYGNDQADFIERQNRSLHLYIYIVIAIIALFISAVGFSTVRRITKSVDHILQRTKHVSEGDLQAREALFYDKDELGGIMQSIDEMAGGLRQLIGEVLHSSENVTIAASEISATTEEVAKGNMHQAESAQTASEVVNALSAGASTVAELAQEATNLTMITNQDAIACSETVNDSIASMNQLSRRMHELEQDSNRIGNIIEVIDEIAEQTNLLALNAAIEAARAGEQGRGFAVVADEVRKLAERSGEATKQITTIIKGMQDSTQDSVKAMSETEKRYQQAGLSLGSIVTRVGAVAQQTKEIAASSMQQARQSQEVMKQIESIASVSEQTAAAAEQTASSSQQLGSLAGYLDKMVNTFRT
ncbi:methyl-accepting chemotaxis protein [Paenibacillus rhizovicinus]|uniref:Methyl-accepting chemotaxis protein n=1 Tax=Paenibacillus rhizovicinus TaxID=2704463 RepID=A0A6C0P9B5_9BACL|nr:HAMP domain-containing methyl-accepting chemotaxis protein [Paenibacillus rhizovicinus]QHW34213.1 methyl-accepting chemotaxis protein [Paenibacillus rhizovicinus]